MTKQPSQSNGTAAGTEFAAHLIQNVTQPQPVAVMWIMNFNATTDTEFAPRQGAPREWSYSFHHTLIKRPIVERIELEQATLDLVHDQWHRDNFLIPLQNIGTS